MAYCKRGRGNLRVNGRPLEMVEPRMLQYKLQEPILLLGKVNIKFLASFGRDSQLMMSFIYPEYEYVNDMRKSILIIP